MLMLFLSPLAVVNVAHAQNVQIEFDVQNMKNLTDQYKVRKILSSLEGVKRVILSDDETGILLTFDDEVGSLFDIKAALAAQGYPATQMVSL